MACYSHIRLSDSCGSYSVKIKKCECERCYILKIEKDKETGNLSYAKDSNCFSEFQNGHERGGK